MRGMGVEVTVGSIAAENIMAKIMVIVTNRNIAYRDG